MYYVILIKDSEVSTWLNCTFFFVFICYKMGEFIFSILRANWLTEQRASLNNFVYNFEICISIVCHQLINLLWEINFSPNISKRIYQIKYCSLLTKKTCLNKLSKKGEVKKVDNFFDCLILNIKEFNDN